MPASTGVTIRVVYNGFDAASEAVHAAAVAQVKETTFSIQARAMAIVPVLTGTLRRSIHSVFERGGLRGLVGPSVFYGVYVEFGTRFTAARPFMRPAAALYLPRFADGLRAKLKRAA